MAVVTSNSYTAVHQWARKNWVKSGVCDECGKEGKTDFANLDGCYRRVREEWTELCRACHVLLDRGPDAFREMAKRTAEVRRAKTHCKNGHDLTGARTQKAGGRVCNACRRDYKRARRAAGLPA